MRRIDSKAAIRAAVAATLDEVAERLNAIGSVALAADLDDLSEQIDQAQGAPGDEPPADAPADDAAPPADDAGVSDDTPPPDDGAGGEEQVWELRDALNDKLQTIIDFETSDANRGGDYVMDGLEERFSLSDFMHRSDINDRFTGQLAQQVERGRGLGLSDEEIERVMVEVATPAPGPEFDAVANSIDSAPVSVSFDIANPMADPVLGPLLKGLTSEEVMEALKGVDAYVGNITPESIKNWLDGRAPLAIETSTSSTWRAIVNPATLGAKLDELAAVKPSTF